MRSPLLAMLLASAAVLAGCVGGDGAQDPAATPQDGDALPALHGWVVDQAIRPLEGVTVTVLDTNSTATTNADGYFGIDEELPIEQFLVVTARLDGYDSGSKQITLTPDAPVRLNFTLTAQPVALPVTEIKQFNGIIACQTEVVAGDEQHYQDCGQGLENRAMWDFTLGPQLAGAVIEVNWNPQYPAADSLGARLETLELGKLNLVLGELVGTSPLSVLVPQSIAEKYYAEGGLMRLTVFARSNGDEVESGVGASLALQQTFAAYASLCYVEPPHPAYSFVQGSTDCQDSP